MFAYFVLPSETNYMISILSSSKCNLYTFCRNGQLKIPFLCKIDIDTFFPEYWINSISFDSCQARNLNPNEGVYYNFRFTPWCHWQIQILLWRMGLMSRKIPDDLANCDAVSHVKNFFWSAKRFGWRVSYITHLILLHNTTKTSQKYT